MLRTESQKKSELLEEVGKLYALLRMLTEKGVDIDDFAQRLRSGKHPDYLESLLRLISNGGLPPTTNHLDLKMPHKSTFTVNDWSYFWWMMAKSNGQTKSPDPGWKPDVIQGDCPFRTGKKISETHFLFQGIATAESDAKHDKVDLNHLVEAINAQKQRVPRHIRSSNGILSAVQVGNISLSSSLKDKWYLAYLGPGAWKHANDDSDHFDSPPLGYKIATATEYVAGCMAMYAKTGILPASFTLMKAYAKCKCGEDSYQLIYICCQHSGIWISADPPTRCGDAEAFFTPYLRISQR